MRVPVDCGNLDAGKSQSKEKTIPRNGNPGEDRKLAWDGAGHATRTHVKFVACFDYGISLVGLFSRELSPDGKGIAQNRTPSFSTLFLSFLLVFRFSFREIERREQQMSPSDEKKNLFPCCKICQTFLTMLYSLSNITNCFVCLDFIFHFIF